MQAAIRANAGAGPYVFFSANQPVRSAAAKHGRRFAQPLRPRPLVPGALAQHDRSQKAEERDKGPPRTPAGPISGQGRERSFPCRKPASREAITGITRPSIRKTTPESKRNSPVAGCRNAVIRFGTARQTPLLEQQAPKAEFSVIAFRNTGTQIVKAPSPKIPATKHAHPQPLYGPVKLSSEKINRHQ